MTFFRPFSPTENVLVMKYEIIQCKASNTLITQAQIMLAQANDALAD